MWTWVQVTCWAMRQVKASFLKRKEFVSLKFLNYILSWLKKNKFLSSYDSLYPNVFGSVVKINDTDKEAKPLDVRPKQA